MPVTDTVRPIATTPTHDVETLNGLLRGVIAAVETYTQALDTFKDTPHVATLRTIRDEHAHAVSTLRGRVLTHGGTPAETAGTWGVFAAAVTGTAQVIGQTPTLAALKQGEESGITNYRNAIDDGHLSDENRFLIGAQLLPQCQQHIATLDRISASL